MPPRTHGRSHTPEYTCWQRAKSRCFNERDKHYADYGGRGITMCDRWRDSFEAFLADLGPRPSPKHSIDRKNNDGHYEPDNCRWADPFEQANNTRRNRVVSAAGEQRTVSEWERLNRTTPGRIKHRLHSGWSAERAVSDPPKLNRLLTHNGETMTMTEWARRVGITVSTIRKRLRLGWPIQRVLATTPGSIKAGALYVTFEGETRTLADWATVRGFPHYTVAQRLRLGWTIERALSTPVTR